MHDLLMAIAIALIPVVMGWIGQQLINNHKLGEQVYKVENLVSMAVVEAEKLGLTKQLTGNEQFQYALNFVNNQLKALGITDVDESLIKAQIERSWFTQKERLEQAYGETNQPITPTDYQQLKSDSATVEKPTPAVPEQGKENIQASQPATSQVSENIGK